MSKFRMSKVAVVLWVIVAIAFTPWILALLDGWRGVVLYASPKLLPFFIFSLAGVALGFYLGLRLRNTWLRFAAAVVCSLPMFILPIIYGALLLAIPRPM